MLVSKYGYRRNKQGQWAKKLVSELNNSQHYVLIKCDECNRLLKVSWANRKSQKFGVDLCKGCAHRGKRNPSYGKDRAGITAHARSFVKNNPMKGKHHSVESRKKMSEIKANQISNGEFDILSNNRGHKSWYTSLKSGEQFHADSALEHFRMIQLDADDNVVRWTKRHHIKIDYMFEGDSHYCVPDFLIYYKSGIVIEEVKGRITAIELAKKEAIETWCMEHGYGFHFATQKILNKNGEYRKFLKERKNI